MDEPKTAVTSSNFGSWLADAQGFSSHTVRAYESDIALFTRFIGADPEAATVTSDHILRFLEFRRSKGLSEATIRRNLAATRSFCRWLQTHDVPVDHE